VGTVIERLDPEPVPGQEQPVSVEQAKREEAAQVGKDVCPSLREKLAKTLGIRGSSDRSG